MAEGVDFSELMKRAVQANAKFYKGWLDLSFEYFRTISGVLGTETETNTPVQEVDTGAGALVLEGEAGTMVHGSFLVSNDMDKPITAAFSGSDFRDPRGASVAAKTSFEPTSLQLAPGEQKVVQVSIHIDDTLSAGVGYAGEISMKGLEGFTVPVVLRRQHSVDRVADDLVSADDLSKSPDKVSPVTKGDTDTVSIARPRGRKRAKKR
ncbi:MAG: hypothetical protein H7066_06040 [Cytophagaceae bacterium]|nr:hypothetical protein [Gemmatimonadaceae bacterium]